MVPQRQSDMQLSLAMDIPLIETTFEITIAQLVN